MTLLRADTIFGGEGLPTYFVNLNSARTSLQEIKVFLPRGIRSHTRNTSAGRRGASVNRAVPA